MHRSRPDRFSCADLLSAFQSPLRVDPIHPLRLYLMKRQVSLEKAAKYLGVSVRLVHMIVGDWYTDELGNKARIIKAHD